MPIDAKTIPGALPDIVSASDLIAEKGLTMFDSAMERQLRLGGLSTLELLAQARSHTPLPDQVLFVSFGKALGLDETQGTILALAPHQNEDDRNELVKRVLSGTEIDQEPIIKAINILATKMRQAPPTTSGQFKSDLGQTVVKLGVNPETNQNLFERLAIYTDLCRAGRLQYLYWEAHRDDSQFVSWLNDEFLSTRQTPYTGNPTLTPAHLFAVTAFFSNNKTPAIIAMKGGSLPQSRFGVTFSETDSSMFPSLFPNPEGTKESKTLFDTFTGGELALLPPKYLQIAKNVMQILATDALSTVEAPTIKMIVNLREPHLTTKLNLSRGKWLEFYQYFCRVEQSAFRHQAVQFCKLMTELVGWKPNTVDWNQKEYSSTN